MTEDKDDPANRYRYGPDGKTGWVEYEKRDADRAVNMVIGIAIVGIVGLVAIVSIVVVLVRTSGGFG